MALKACMESAWSSARLCCFRRKCSATASAVSTLDESAAVMLLTEPISTRTPSAEAMTSDKIALSVIKTPPTHHKTTRERATKKMRAR